MVHGFDSIDINIVSSSNLLDFSWKLSELCWLFLLLTLIKSFFVHFFCICCLSTTQFTLVILSPIGATCLKPWYQTHSGTVIISLSKSRSFQSDCTRFIALMTLPYVVLFPIRLYSFWARFDSSAYTSIQFEFHWSALT